MKKMSREKIVELLRSRNCSYRELAKISGYHEKSLIRLNSQLRNGQYKDSRDLKSNYEKIIDDYRTHDFKNYRDFYNARKQIYKYKYSTICKILGSTRLDTEILFVKKIKNQSDYHFLVVDGQSGRRLMRLDSCKNDFRSVKKIIFWILSNCGAPSKICFVNFFKVVPSEIDRILKKYRIDVILFSSIYRNNLKESAELIEVKYRHVNIIREDFYYSTIRKCILVNSVQFRNVRYKILSRIPIPKNSRVTLYCDENGEDIFVLFNGEKFEVEAYKRTMSKRGNTKYY